MSRAARAVLWALLALFALTIVINVAQHPLDADETEIDEQAHLSYSYYLIDQHRWWPDFDHFPMYTRTTGKALTDVNYLNHPPTFYWLAKLAHAVVPIVDGYDYRHAALAVSLLGIFLYGLIGQRLAMPLAATALFALMPWLIYMHKQIGFYNNDCLAIFGGLLATYASLDWFNGRNVTRAFWLLVLGIALATVKLTALLLVGIYVAVCLIANRSMLRSISWKTWVIAAFVLALCSLPVLHLMLQTGSPAPNTLGQRILMTQHPPGENWSRILINGWVQEPHKNFLPWFIDFLRGFATQVSRHDTTFIPLLLIAFTVLRRPVLPRPTTRMLRAGLIATALTFTVHTFFAWGRYQQYAWQLDAGLRYYYPLLGVYGAACGTALSGLSRREQETV